MENKYSVFIRNTNQELGASFANENSKIKGFFLGDWIFFLKLNSYTIAGLEINLQKVVVCLMQVKMNDCKSSFLP